MNSRRIALAALAAFAITVSAFAASPNVVISQVYGAGGNSGAVLDHDYVELFNRGTSPVTLTGWSVQYASATGTGPFSSNVTLLTGTINPGQYYLIQESGGSNGGALPTPDTSGTISMAAGAGKVALVNSTTGLACNGGSTPCSPAQLAQILDLVGYGTANFHEGSASAPTISAILAAFRADDGCTDSDDNAADFATGTPAPRNSSSPTHSCGTSNNAPTITAPADPIATVDQDSPAFNVALSGFDDGGVYTWSATATPGSGISAVSVSAGQGTANVTYQVTLLAGYIGTASFNASLSDGVNAAAAQTVNINVRSAAINDPPAITSPANPITTVTKNAAPFNVNLTGTDDGAVYQWSATAGTGISSVTVSNANSSTATFTVTLQTGFTGSATFTAALSDGVNPAASQAVNITVNPPSVPAGTIVISQFYGGGHNAGSTLNNDYIELFNRSDDPVDLEGWAVQSYSFFDSSWAATPLHGTIQPHHYFLVQERAGTTASGGTTPLPTPDVQDDVTDVGSTSGHVALTSSTTVLTTRCSTSASIADFVGYSSSGTGGNNATCSGRVTIPPSLSNTIAASRVLGGCKYTNSVTDWSIGAPAPRNSSAPANDCSITSEETAPHVMISQIYGGGGNGSALYTNDYIELYNPAPGAVSLDGWSVQYASASGSSWQSQPLGGTVEGHSYFLIQLAAGTSTDPGPIPPPRIISDINMSASSGKVALVQTFAALSGNCPVGDPNLVDLLGYGSADCFEGGSDAPGLSGNRDALIRPTNSDTNQNSVDFVRTTSPDPRGTGALVELPPFVTSFEPAVTNLAASFPNYAAHDASIVANFSEPVDVHPGWFSIDCDDSVAHTDVDIQSAFGGRTWIVTPNAGAGFTAGANCTVHIYKDFVTDVDEVDGPNEDNLTTDVSWTFVVAPADAIETPEVHLTMGNPSNAIDSLATPNNYLMKKPSFAESYSRDNRTPNWVSWHLTGDWVGSLPRVDTFRPDPELPPDWRVLQSDYSGSGFERGHMCPNADRDGLVAPNRETFLMSNMVPQSLANNEGPWAKFESYLRTLLPANELYIVSGPYGNAGQLPSGVTIPEGTWKVVLVLTAMDGNDVARVTPATRTIAIVIPNGSTVNKSDDWPQYVTTVRAVEDLTGYDFFSNVPAIIQNSIEPGRNGANLPGVADQSVNATEDEAAAVSLTAVSPDAAATFSYTVVAPPSHGTLSGSGPAYTYTPAPDFYGDDAFRYQVNDGHANSIDATVTIHVAGVNDPPVANGDSAALEAGHALTIPASTLAANDLAGPANESGQSLTVTAVSASGADSATLAGGVVTFTPPPSFTGTTSFAYTVCDNGSPVLCATGTVTVDVRDSTAPSVTPLVLSATQLWPANHQMVSVSVDYTATDLVDSAPQCTLSVLSNEPADGTGDGDTAPDWQIVDAHHVLLRAERAGAGDGRVYTIGADCADASGNAGHASATVLVPKSQK